MTVIAAQRLTKTFGAGETAVTAVQRVDVSVEAGEIVMLLGPSGSGKTTLVSMLGGLLQPTDGEVRIADRALPRSPAQRARLRLTEIGFIFQTFNLLNSFTAIDNVALPLRLMGTPGKVAKQRAEELLVALGLGSRLSASPRTLSGGEKQRVSIARALVANPLVLLADEPTASLDTKTGRETMEVLAASVHSGDHACLVVTHDTRLVGFADRVLHLEDGRIIAS
jgi:putative ABC transport system ATP-binding protein